MTVVPGKSDIDRGAQPSTTQSKFGSYIHSLDGIRAIAVLIVVLSHTGYGAVVKGRPAVTVFFFLSGYLITTLMVKEYEKKGTIEIPKFYGRRFVRLLPAVLISLPAIYLATAAGLIPGTARLSTLFGQLFYLANYQEVFVENIQRPAGTEVLWSLAIEEHFYILYPLLLLPLLKRFSLKQVFGILAALCAATLAWRFYLAVQPDFNPERNALSSDTRADSILFGCMLALTKITHINREKVDNAKLPLHGFVLFGLGALAFLFTFVMTNELQRETIRYTIQGLALFPLLYYPIVYHRHRLFSFLENSVLKKIGVFSYVIYLVHFPLYHGLVANIEVLANSREFATIATIAVSCIIAWALDVFVDGPLHKVRANLR